MNNTEAWIAALLKPAQYQARPRWVPSFLWPSYARRYAMLRELLRPLTKTH